MVEQKVLPHNNNDSNGPLLIRSFVSIEMTLILYVLSKRQNLEEEKERNTRNCFQCLEKTF